MGFPPDPARPAALRRRWILAGAAIGGAGLIGAINADRLGRQLYDRWRPELERRIGRALGRPLILGPYQGLRPWGLAVGPSRLEAVPSDDSTLEVQGLEVAIDPLASLAQRLPVLRLRGQGAALTLRRNASGQYWVFGGGLGKQPPRLRLTIQLVDTARLAIRPAGLDLNVLGTVGVSLDQKSVDGHLRAALPRRGRLRVKGGGNWGSRDLRLNLALQEVELAQLASLLPPRRTLVSGRLDGQLALARQRGRNDCRGTVRLRGLAVRDPLLPEPLQASRLGLSCSGDQLRLARGRWRMANWEGEARAQVAWNRALEVDLTASDPRRGDRLALTARGEWNRPRLRLDGHIPLGRGTPASPAPLKLAADLSADLRRDPSLDLDRLTLRSGRSELTARGAVWPRLDLRSTTARFHPSLWSAAPALGSLLGRSETLQGSLRARGTVRTPLLTGSLERQGRTLLSFDAAAGGSRSRPGPLGLITANLAAPGGIRVERTALIGPATARLEWSDDQLRLAEFRSPELQASGSLPLRWQKRRGLVTGDLALGLSLAPFSLPRLSPLLGVRMQGDLSASGRVSGPLNGLKPDLQLTVRNPGSGPLQLMETWSGRLTPVSGGGGDLAMASVRSAVPGVLRARLDRGWLPRDAALERSSGMLRFSGTPKRYGWQAKGLPLQGLRLRLNGEAEPMPLVGLLGGRGAIELQPLAMEGEASLEGSQLWGIQGRRLTAKGTYRQNRFQLAGLLEPKAGGRLAFDLAGSRGGPLRATLEGRKLPLELIAQVASAGTQLRGTIPLPPRRASQLGAMVIDTLGGTLQGQLAALDAAREQVASVQAGRAGNPTRRREDLRGLIDADIRLNGPDLRRLELEAAVKAHLWIRGEDRDLALAREPIVLRLEGPLRGGRGGFGLQGLPLSLLALLTPVPGGLRGVLDLDGRYRLGGRGRSGRDRAFRTTIALRDGSINGRPLELADAQVRLEENNLAVRGELRRGGASSGIELTGTIPLDPGREGLRVRLSSRGDGLSFVNDLAPGLNWNRGSADLELLVRGRLREPVANGFLRVRGGELKLAGQAIRELEATVLFDFEELLVQEFRARMGERGVLTASGGLGLFQPRPQRNPLRMEVQQARVTVPRLNALADGLLELQGTLLRPLLTGDLRISRGTVNAQQAPLARPNGNAAAQPVTVQRLMEEKWDFRQPLLLLGPEVETASGQAVRQSVPNFPYLRLSDLRVEIGPDLQVLVPPVASFRTGGRLTLDGPIDPSLTARGVVRLKGGRLTLFTTTFTLDPDAPNVAVFTPALGLVPYLDIALRTRVSNSLDLGQQRGVVNSVDLRGDFTPLDQLNLVRVVVSVSGPADRLGESLVIRSNPPLPQSRLVALIGGNSLAGLSGGNAGAALATVVGQSLLSPLVTSLTDAFGQRFSFAIYPSYVVPTDRQATTRTSRRVPSQLVLGTEAGIDLSERFNFSVLAAPNRSDIPPQGTLRYQASDTLGLQGSVDTEGRWQGQLQLFFRF